MAATTQSKRGQALAKWVAFLAVGLVVAGGIAAGAWYYLTPSVVVTEAVEGPVVQAFYATGTVEPTREYPVRSNTAGTLREVLVDKGDAVTRGQPLARVENPQLQFERDRAAAELDEKRKRAAPETSPVLADFDARIEAMANLLEISERERDRLETLVTRSSATTADLDRARDAVQERGGQLSSLRAQRRSSELELAREVAVAEAALRAAESDLAEQTIPAPSDGVVLDRPTPTGTRVAVNETILRVADVSPGNLVMRAAVDEEDVARVSAGQEVAMSLYSFAGRPLSGRVTRVYDQADDERRTFEVDVAFENPPDRLAAGMTGELAFILSRREGVVVVPAQAVQKGGAVFVVRDGRIERSGATVGVRSVQRAEVSAGLGVGDTVVISPVAESQVGKPARTTKVDPAEAAGLNQEELPSDGGGFGGF